MTVYNNKLYFQATGPHLQSNNPIGAELWAYKDSFYGSWFFTDINPGADSSDPVSARAPAAHDAAVTTHTVA